MTAEFLDNSAIEESGSTLSGRAILGATIGNMLEFYDFVTYAFFAIQIGHCFFPAESQYASLMLSLATFGAGFLTRPLGGIVIGAYSDRKGRRAAMMLSLVLMGAAIITLALTPSYAAIGIAAPIIVIVARMVQGFSLGGEVGPTTAYLMEAAPVASRGFCVAWQPASQAIASTAGGLVGVGLSAVMTDAALDSYGWRIAFLIGAMSLPFGLWVRRNLPETLLFQEAGTAITDDSGSILDVERANARLIVLGLLILAGGTITTYVTKFMTTYAENTLHVATNLAFTATTICNGIGIAAALWSGWLSDRVGRWPVMVVAQVATFVITYPIFLWMVSERSAWSLIGGLGLLSFVNSIPYAAFYVALSEGLPKRIRGGAFATIYATAIAVFGGTAQLVVTWLIHVTDNPLAPAWYLLLASGVALIAMTMMKETAPVKLATLPALAE